MPFDRDLWLSEVMQRPVFKYLPITHTGVHPKLNRQFSYVKIPTNDIKTVITFLEDGFYVVDVNVQFGRRDFANSEPFLTFEFEQKDKEQLLLLAETCFVYSRFHLDPLISKDTANSIKKEWIRSYLDGRRGTSIRVSRRGNKVTGFAAYIKNDTDHIIDLIAIDPDFRRMGHAKGLIRSFGISPIIVGTQAANIPSVQLYENLGFRLISSQYVLHKHG